MKKVEKKYNNSCDRLTVTPTRVTMKFIGNGNKEIESFFINVSEKMNAVTKSYRGVFSPKGNQLYMRSNKYKDKIMFNLS